MLCTSIKKVVNDTTVVDPTTSTFEVEFDGARLYQLARSNGIPLGGYNPAAISVGIYETIKHGDTATYTIVTNKDSSLDELPIRFLVTAASDCWKITRPLRGSENVDLEYVVGKGTDEEWPLFLNAALGEIPRFSWMARQQCERETIEAFKVGLFLFELEKIDPWENIPMKEADDMGEWVEIEKRKGHTMEACNGFGLLESSRKGIH